MILFHTQPSALLMCNVTTALHWVDGESPVSKAMLLTAAHEAGVMIPAGGLRDWSACTGVWSMDAILSRGQATDAVQARFQKDLGSSG